MKEEGQKAKGDILKEEMNLSISGSIPIFPLWRRIQYNQFRGGRMAVRTVYDRRVRSLRGARGLTWRVLNLNEIKEGASFNQTVAKREA